MVPLSLMAFDVWFALGGAAGSSATKSATFANELGLPRSPTHPSLSQNIACAPRMFLILCCTQLQASFHCPVVDGPLIDWAMRCVVFDDVFCGTFSVWCLCSLQPRFGATKSALLWPMHWAATADF